MILTPIAIVTGIIKDRPQSLFIFRASGNLKGKQDWQTTLELAILLRIIIIMASTIAMKMEDKQ